MTEMILTIGFISANNKSALCTHLDIIASVYCYLFRHERENATKQGTRHLSDYPHRIVGRFSEGSYVRLVAPIRVTMRIFSAPQLDRMKFNVLSSAYTEWNLLHGVGPVIRQFVSLLRVLYRAGSVVRKITFQCLRSRFMIHDRQLNQAR